VLDNATRGTTRDVPAVLAPRGTLSVIAPRASLGLVVTSPGPERATSGGLTAGFTDRPVSTLLVGKVVTACTPWAPASSDILDSRGFDVPNSFLAVVVDVTAR
jgi:hypothetical protein